jgi:hypothetical protein
MADRSVKVREMSFKDASAALVAANGKLQKAAKGADLCVAALEFASAERVARGAKQREAGSVIEGLNPQK